MPEREYIEVEGEWSGTSIEKPSPTKWYFKLLLMVILLTGGIIWIAGLFTVVNYCIQRL